MEEELCLLCLEHRPPPQPNQVGGYQPTPRRSGLAIAALVVGIVSLVLCWVPILNNLILFLAIIGLGLGIAAIVITKKKQATRSGFGMALAGTILSVVAIIGVVATQALYVKALDAAIDNLNSPSASSTEANNEEIDSANSDSTDTDDENTDSAFTSDPTTTPTIDDYLVTIDSFSMPGPDEEGKPTAKVTYTVTNNSNESIGEHYFGALAYQDGIQLVGPALYRNPPDDFDPYTSMEILEPGDSFTATAYYRIANETLPVTIEIVNVSINDQDGNAAIQIAQTFPLQ